MITSSDLFDPSRNSTGFRYVWRDSDGRFRCVVGTNPHRPGEKTGRYQGRRHETARMAASEAAAVLNLASHPRYGAPARRPFSSINHEDVR